MKKLGVLGGSFDPPHLGHLLMIRQILELRPDIDEILLVPVNKHQWKDCHASSEDRVNMLTSLTNNSVSISDIELKRTGISYTVDTVRELKEQTGAEIYWIVGSDILGEFDKWEKTEELINLTTFLVFPRDPYHLPKALPKGFEVIAEKHLITTNISSTSIRKRIEQEKTIEYLVPKEIEEYIKIHKLYK